MATKTGCIWLMLLTVPLTACGSSESDTGGGTGGTGTVTCGPSSAAALVQCVEQQRLESDVTTIAQPRPPGSAQWQAVQDLCADRFAQYGYDVERHQYATGVNVIGKRVGKTKPGEEVIISAHYDHIPNCPGADDNASGVAGLLETARVLAQREWDRTLIVACWDEEEKGLIGSRAYATRAEQQGETIVSMTSLEMIGYRDTAPETQTVPAGFNLLFADEYSKIEDNQFRADFVAMVSTDGASATANAMRAHADADGTPNALLMLDSGQAQSPLLADLRRSDHASFWDHGYPAILVTDTSNFRYAQYHCGDGDDVPSLLDFGFMTAVTRAQLGAHADMLGIP